MKRILFGLLLLVLPSTVAAQASFFVLEAAPGEIGPGDTAVLNITLKNLGVAETGYATYLKAALDPSDTSPIDPIGGGEKFITKKAVEAAPGETYFGSVQQNEEVMVSFPIYVPLGTTEGVYEVPLVLSWRDYRSQDQTQTLQIGILVKGDIDLGIASFTTDPTVVRSGDDNVKITLTFENTGEATAEDVKADLLLEPPFSPTYSQSDKAYVGRLDSNAMTSVMFYVDIEENVEPGRYSIPLEVTYKDKRNQEYAQKESIDFIVEPKPYFEVTRTASDPANPRAGDHTLLYIDVKNIGHEKAESADLRVVRETGQPFTYDIRSDFIGTLNPGETGTAVLEFEVDTDAVPKEYPLKLMVRCTGDTEKGDTNIYTQELKAAVHVEAGVPEERTTLRYTAVAILGILAVIAALSILRRQKQG